MRVLLYSYSTTIAGWGVLLKDNPFLETFSNSAQAQPQWPPAVVMQKQTRFHLQISSKSEHMAKVFQMWILGLGLGFQAPCVLNL